MKDKRKRDKPREYACVLAPALPLQALVRSEPDLTGRPVATLSGKGSRAVITYASRLALNAGARPGMTPSQAGSIAPGLVLRDVSDRVLQAAEHTLLDIALAWSPRVQPSKSGAVLLDMSGTRRMYPSRASMCCALQAACAKAGLRVRVSVASGPRIARIAASSGRGVTIVPHGREAATLSPLPLTALSPSQALRGTLTRLGIRTIGDFAALNGRGLGIRLGREAMDLHRLARGRDHSPLQPVRPSEVFEESVSLDYTVDNAEPLIFLLSSCMERLSARLEARLLAPASLHLSLTLDPEGRHEIGVNPPAPTSDIHSLLTLTRLALDSDPPPLPVSGFTLRADGGSVSPSQGHLFGPPLPEPGRLAGLLGRLTAIAGPDNVGSPAVLDSHARDPSALARFDPEGIPGDPTPGTRPVLVFRRLSPPLGVSVDTMALVPVRVRGPGLSGRVIRNAGPWYTGTDWWTGHCQAGALHDAEVAGHGLVRLWHDLLTDRWFVDGLYD